MVAEVLRLLALLEEAAAALEWEWYGPAPGVDDPCPAGVSVEYYRERLLERLTACL